MKQFRVSAFFENGVKSSGDWKNCEDWTLRDIIDFIVPAFKRYNWLLEYREVKYNEKNQVK